MILTVLSGRQETEWFDIEVADEYSVEHLKLMLGVRIFGEPPAEGMQYIMEAKFPEGLWFRVGITSYSQDQAYGKAVLCVFSALFRQLRTKRLCMEGVLCFKVKKMGKYTHEII